MSDHKWDRFKRVFGGKPSDALIGVRDGKVKTALAEVAVQLKRVTDLGFDGGELQRRHDALEQSRVDALTLPSNRDKSDTLDTIKSDARALAGEAPAMADDIIREATEAREAQLARQLDGEVQLALTQVAAELKRVTDRGLDGGELQRRHDTVAQARLDALGLPTSEEKATALDLVRTNAQQLAGQAARMADDIIREAAEAEARLLEQRVTQLDGEVKAALAQVALEIKRVTDRTLDATGLQARHDLVEKSRTDALTLATNAEKAEALDRAKTAALQLAGEAAGLADGILRGPLETRQQLLVTALGTIPGRIAGLTLAPPPGVGTALTLCVNARDAAALACAASPLDWAAADLALTNFSQAKDALGTACLDGAGVMGTGFANRFKAEADNKPAGKAIIKAYADHSAARKIFDDRITAADGLGALEAAAGLEAAVAAFELAASPSDKAKKKTAKTAFDTLTSTTDEDLDKKTLQEKAELALDLCANGTPDEFEEVLPSTNPKTFQPTPGSSLDQLCRLYKHSAPDPVFMQKRETQREQIASELLKMDEVKKLHKKNGDLDDDYWDDFTKDADKVLQLMQKICDTQADAMGMDRIVVSKDPDPPQDNGTMGGYDPATNSIGLNFHPGYLKPVSEAFDTIIHETFHAHQDAIVKRLKAGKIGPGDDEYATALMYMVNDIPVGYVDGDEVGNDNYKTQPTEFDSFHHAGETVTNLLGKAKTAAMA